MDTSTLIAYFLINTVLAAIIGGWGESRKIGFWPAFLISLLLSALFGVIAVALSESSSDKEIVNNPNFATSTAEELIKFKSLLDDGAITQDEYDQQKKRLLK